MKVLGIDPGYDRLGVALLEGENGKEILLYSSCIETSKNAPLTERLFKVGNEVEKLLEVYKPEIVGIETLFFNKNQKTAIGVAQARGIIIFLAQKHNARVCEYGPQEIKVAVTGYGKSDKTAVIDMVKRLVSSVPEHAHDDEFEAIAVGLTTLAHNRHV